MCNAYYGYTGWLGIASIAVSDGVHISHATVRLNDTYFDQWPYSEPE